MLISPLPFVLPQSIAATAITPAPALNTDQAVFANPRPNTLLTDPLKQLAAAPTQHIFAPTHALANPTQQLFTNPTQQLVTNPTAAALFSNPTAPVRFSNHTQGLFQATGAADRKFDRCKTRSGVVKFANTTSTSATPSTNAFFPSTQVNVPSTLITSFRATSSSLDLPPPISSLSAAALPSSSAALPTNLAASDKYVAYTGDGSTADGWPSMDDWLDFDYIFKYNTPQMRLSCAQWGVPNDSSQELADMKASIASIAESTGVDARFILAVILQESTGCVRVITTAYSHNNPGLMQSFNGTGSCNGNSPAVGVTGTVLTPCPQSEIHQQISDGTAGTQWGPGLQQDFAQQGLTGAQGYYRTARIYNGGSLSADGSLEGPCCTASYVSDVANRLMGWAYSARTFGY